MARKVTRHIQRTVCGHKGESRIVRTERFGWRKTWWETRCPHCGRLAQG